MSQKVNNPTNGTVIESDDGLRLEVWLAQNIEGLSRHKAIEAIREGLVFVDGRKAKKGMRVTAGQAVDLALETRTRTVSESPTVLFSNKDLAIANKPAGMPCHALRLGETGTLLQWVGERFPEVLKIGKSVREGGLLHRLDTDTSGCVAFAQNQKTYDELRPKFADGGIGKIYLAVVSDGGTCCGTNRCTCCGSFRDETNLTKLPEVGKSVTIKIPLGRHPSDAGRMVALIDGDERHKGPALGAKTMIKTLAKGKDCALVEATIERGRMHQIRVHLAAIGHPIIGDKTYGGTDCGTSCGTNGGIERQALHAYKLIIDNIETVAPVPKDFRELCAEKHISLID